MLWLGAWPQILGFLCLLVVAIQLWGSQHKVRGWAVVC